MKKHFVVNQKNYLVASNFEKKINRLITATKYFVNKQETPAVFLITATTLAMMIINIYSPNMLDEIANMKFGVTFPGLDYTLTIKQWVNRGLMTIFFLLIGLEIKREIILGKRYNNRELLLIMFASLGGIIIPALIYTSLNYHAASSSGWIIPTVTDTAFSIGILAIFTDILSLHVLMFFTSIIIFDDIFSMIILTSFSNNLYYMPMLPGLFILCCLITFNKLGVKSAFLYSGLSILLWHYFSKAGIHSSLIGLIIALCIPIRTSVMDKDFVKNLRGITSKLEKEIDHEFRYKLTHEISTLVDDYTPAIRKWERNLTLPVCIGILPLFAFFNSGIVLSYYNMTEAWSSPVLWGIISGLVIGKPLGIIAFCSFASWTGICKMPRGLSIREIMCIVPLGGIGFTMSMYNADFVFSCCPKIIIYAKFGILIASSLSSIIAIYSLNRMRTKQKQ